MKKIAAIALSILVGIGIAFQAHSSKGVTQKGSKKHKMPDSTEMKYHGQALAAIKDTMFVFNADRVIFNNGISISVNSNTNFISVNKEHAIVQIAFDIPEIGHNGLGGITVEGRVSTIRIRTNKKGFIFYEFYVNGPGIFAKVEFTLNPTNNLAQVIITPNSNNSQLTLSGSIVPTDNADIFKGSTY